MTRAGNTVHGVIRVVECHFHDLAVGLAHLTIGPGLRIHLVQVAVAVIAVICPVHVFSGVDELKDLRLGLVLGRFGRVEFDHFIAGTVVPVVEQVAVQVAGVGHDLDAAVG